MFHDLLIILTISDVAVVICCALQFALPSLWDAYTSKAYPHILQFLLPVMHITVMISVYTTILIRYENLSGKVFVIIIVKKIDSDPYFKENPVIVK